MLTRHPKAHILCFQKKVTDSIRTQDDMADISATEPDWEREKQTRWWAPSRQLLRTIRRYNAPGHKNGLQRKWLVLQHRFWSVMTGADIPINTQIGGGLIMPHPNGIVIHAASVIGPNCILFQQVTLGTNRQTGAPHLGGHVDVGPGAKILGNVRIGDHAVIGANAVVIQDVPAGATAVGVPAKILPGYGIKAPDLNTTHHTGQNS